MAKPLFINPLKDFNLRALLSSSYMLNLYSMIQLATLAMLLLGLNDGLPRFHGLAKVETGGGLAYASFRSEDLPGDGFKNRFHVILMSGSVLRVPALTREADYVTVTAMAEGHMKYVFGWGQILFIPMDKNVKEKLKAAAPGTETRRQLVTTRKADGVLEILIEEPL